MFHLLFTDYKREKEKKYINSWVELLNGKIQQIKKVREIINQNRNYYFLLTLKELIKWQQLLVFERKDRSDVACEWGHSGNQNKTKQIINQNNSYYNLLKIFNQMAIILIVEWKTISDGVCEWEKLVNQNKNYYHLIKSKYWIRLY